MKLLFWKKFTNYKLFFFTWISQIFYHKWFHLPPTFKDSTRSWYFSTSLSCAIDINVILLSFAMSYNLPTQSDDIALVASSNNNTNLDFFFSFPPSSWPFLVITLWSSYSISNVNQFALLLFYYFCKCVTWCMSMRKLSDLFNGHHLKIIQHTFQLK